MLPAHPLAAACAIYTYESDTRHSHAHMQRSIVSWTQQPISIGYVSWITGAGDSLLPMQL